MAPSAVNDLAFTQSMVAALDSLKTSYNLQISISDNEFVVSDAANLIRQYASQGYNLVIAHGSQYGSILQRLAPKFRKVSFAWGTAGSTFNEPNIYAYQANSNEGGYVQGYMAGMLSKSHVIGVIGPIDVGDAQLYCDGFKAGVLAQDPKATVHVSFTGSFSDVTLMASAAKAYVADGADVLTGSSQSVVGAIGDRQGRQGRVVRDAVDTERPWRLRRSCRLRSTTGSQCSSRSSPASGAGSSAAPPTRSRWATTAKRSCSTRSTRSRRT